MSDNLVLTQMTVGQTNKETTHNDSNGEIDAAMTEQEEISVASGNAVLTTEQYTRNQFFLVTGAVSSPDLDRTITLPLIKRLTMWRASSANTRPVTLSYGSPAQTAKLYPGSSAVIYTDGTATGFYRLTEEVYDFGFSLIGSSSADQATLGRVVFPRAAVIPANFDGAEGYIATNPSATVTIDVRSNGASVGTISISTGGSFTFTTVSGSVVNISAGDVVEFMRTSSPDVTITDATATLAAYPAR